MGVLPAVRCQIASEIFSLSGNNTLDLADLVVDGMSPREVFHMGINHQGGDAEKAVLTQFLDKALAGVRKMPSYSNGASFTSAQQLVSHIKHLADTELKTVPSYGPE